MRKLAAVALILALPALVMADINRLKLSPDLDRPDALPWNVRRTQLSLPAVPVGLPVWSGPSVPLVSRCCKSEFLCPCAAPQHVTRCQCEPDRPDRTSVPVLWPHAPRADERKTAAKEPRQEQVQVPNNQPAN